MVDPDIWWHLRNAQFLITHHAFIRTDMYSFTAAGAPWMNHEWLAELPFYLGWRFAGDRGLYCVTVLAVEIIMFGIFALAYRNSRSPRAALFVTVIAALLSTVSYGPRTLLFGWVWLIVELLILTESEHRPKLVWCLPIVFGLWVNTHGSWMIGLVLLILYLVTGSVRFHCGALYCDGFSRTRLRSLLLSSLLSVCVVFVNPYGWRLVAYPFNLAFHQKLNVTNVEEWRSLDFHSPRGVIVLAFLGLLILLQLCRERQWKLREIAYLFLAIYAAFNYSRFLFLFAILAAPIAARSFAIWKSKAATPTRPLINAAVVLVFLGVIAGNLRTADLRGRQEWKKFPVEALPFLSSFHPQGPVFNEFLWGGYMIWNSRQWPVFIDSRVDIFEYNGTFKDYLDIVRIHNTLQLLDKYKIRYIFFEKDTPLVYLIQHVGGWKVDYESEKIIFLERATVTSRKEVAR